jgi:uncharacterized membrane protein
MKGNVIGFDPDTNAGAISGHDGKRYDFVRLEWHSPAQPSRGTIVEFIPAGLQATQIYPVCAGYDPGQGETAKVVYILYLASVIVGVTGIIGVIIACELHRRTRLGQDPLPVPDSHVLDRPPLRADQPCYRDSCDRHPVRAFYLCVVDRAQRERAAASVARRAL